MKHDDPEQLREKYNIEFMKLLAEGATGMTPHDQNVNDLTDGARRSTRHAV